MNNVGQILALDLARRTGWALGRINDKAPLCGSLRFAKESAPIAETWVGFRKWLGLMLDENPRICLGIFESPLAPTFLRGRTTFQTGRALIGMAAIAEEYLHSRGIEVREATVADVRTHFLGSNKHKREIAKDLTIRQCRLLGWEVVDDNAADACALWDYQRALFINENLRIRAGA